VLDARGLAAKDLFSDLRGVRGELVWLQAPDVDIKRPTRFLHPRYPLYLVPRPNHVYLLGASEIEAEDTSPISVRTLLELLTAAYCLNPKFTEARVLKTVTQVRPTLLDHLPKIKHTDGLMAVNGLYRHGFLIAPALVAEMMTKFSDKPCSYSSIWEFF
jgi:glycine oxidase